MQALAHPVGPGDGLLPPRQARHELGRQDAEPPHDPDREIGGIDFASVLLDCGDHAARDVEREWRFRPIPRSYPINER
jgi:hypothetical protein